MFAFHAISLVTFARGTVSALSLDASSPRPVAVVVGGGPVGAAAALTLASGHYDVTVYEASSSTSGFDATKSFSYNLNARGRSFTRQFPFVDHLVTTRGVSSDDAPIRIVPADPKATLPDPVTINMGQTEPSYWIPRHVMNGIMSDSIENHNREAGEGEGAMGQIRYLSSHRFLTVRPVERDGSHDTKLSVTVRDLKTDEEFDQEAALVVGADGWKSSVREHLYGQRDRPRSAFRRDSFPAFQPQKFKLVERTSPATNLQFKAIQVPAEFAIPTFDADDHDAVVATTPVAPFTAVILRSTTTGPRDTLSLNMLPNNDVGSRLRPANTITRPSHHLWNLRTGEAVRSFFVRLYPRLAALFDEIPADEWTRFAEAEGTTFPPCARSPGLVVTSGDGGCGIVLVGDAAHCFPPDLGQGVNSGLDDVRALGHALSSDGTTLGKALTEYERRRAPETKALVRACRFGSPYQYRQCTRADRFLAKVFAANLVLRVLLNKATFGLLSGPVLLYVNDPGLSFRKIMRRADRTTAFLWCMVVVGLWRVLLRR